MSTKREISCVRNGERRPEFHLFLRPLLKKQTRVLAAGRRLRGRPIGSKNKPKILSVLTGDNCNTFKFHTIKINDGVDILKRLFDFSKRQKRAISIVTGNGVVEKARFLHSNGGITTLHGTFHILSVSGIILPPPKLESEAKLAISLSILEENVFGGSVISSLIASGLVTLKVISFENIIVEKLSSMVNDHIKREP